jgi:hypothetical protein
VAIPPFYINLGFVSDETNPLQGSGSGGSPLTGLDAPPGNHSEVFGLSIVKYLDLGTVIDSSEAPPDQGPGSGPDWVEPPGGWPPAQWVYGVTINNLLTRTINLGAYDSPVSAVQNLWGLAIFQRRPTTYFRVQVDGGGRQVMYASYGDDSPRRFFEMWKDGIRFSFLGLPDPIVQLRSPSGIITNRTVWMRGRAYGRFGVDLGELNEVGDWKLQIRFVEESDSLGASVEQDPLLDPSEPIGELWRALHKPLTLRVCAGSEEIW